VKGQGVIGGESELAKVWTVMRLQTANHLTDTDRQKLQENTQTK